MYSFPLFRMSCCLPGSAKGIAAMLLRISFGLGIMLIGIEHYQEFAAFSTMVTSDLGVLTLAGKLWAILFPAFLIIGGALFVWNRYCNAGAWFAGLALGSIPVGMLLKAVVGGLELGIAMQAAMNALLWLIVYWLVVKCCGCCCGNPACGGCGACKK